jgi:NAD(P)-dependent dehydrogenase (short-subunit alcohol dehydrogenase family)
VNVAVVTGAAGALGSAVLDDLTGRGWTVAAFDRPGDRLDQAGQRDGVVPVPVDLLDRASVRAAFEQVDDVGAPTALVALAGAFRSSSLDDLDEDLLDAMWSTNVTALLWCAQAAAPRMAAAGGGSIVTVGSRSAGRVRREQGRRRAGDRGAGRRAAAAAHPGELRAAVGHRQPGQPVVDVRGPGRTGGSDVGDRARDRLPARAGLGAGQWCADPGLRRRLT